MLYWQQQSTLLKYLCQGVVINGAHLFHKRLNHGYRQLPGDGAQKALEKQAPANFPGAQSSNDSIFRAHDMEGSDGRHQVRISCCSCVEVRTCFNCRAEFVMLS